MTTPHPTSREILERLAAELTPDQLDTWLLRTINGWSFQRIADHTATSKQGAHQRYAAANRRIQQLTVEGAWPWTT